jgi:hypothetical protein
VRFRRAFVIAITLAAANFVSPVFSQAPTPPLSARFLRYDEIAETLAKFATSELPGSTIDNAGKWDEWIRAQDCEVRSRIDRGAEDSISNLILYGTSFTALPRVANLDEVVDASGGKLKPLTASRIRQLEAALDSTRANERVKFIRSFLQQQRVDKADRQRYLTANLTRLVSEHHAYDTKLDEASSSQDKTEVFATRGTLYATRGLSVDTSLLPNFAVEDSLRVMVAKNALRPGSVHRIAVIGPGLDFTDKRDGYDFYPLQTIQPFAMMEAVERLGLGHREDLRVVTLDLNAAVNAHVARIAANGAAGRAYVVQLPRDSQAQWTDAAVAYWRSFGEVIGRPAKPLPIPQQLPGVELRAVTITADRAANISPVDLNIVAQSIDFPKDQGFDLVVATNILVYYDHFQQALAMSNVARMMNSGGIFISNTPLPAAHDERLHFLGRRVVSYAQDASYGDDIMVYQKVE